MVISETYVVIEYQFSAAATLYSSVHGNSKGNTAPLIHPPSIVKSQYKEQLKNKRPMDARTEVIERNGGYVNAPAEFLLPRTAVYNLAQHTDDRNFQSKAGRIPEIDFDAIERMKKNPTILK